MKNNTTTLSLEERINKYGRNKFYFAFSKCPSFNKGQKTYHASGQKKILFDGRYTCVAGFFFSIINDELCVLANKRGKGTPDYQGYWNCPCGYLERYETAAQGIQRETMEECGYLIPLDKIKTDSVETDPASSNKGNVTIRHKALIDIFDIKWDEWKDVAGEKDEVDEVKWVPVKDIDNYKWAFNHKELIRKMKPTKIKTTIAILKHKLRRLSQIWK